MRDDTIRCAALVDRDPWCELQPGGTQLQQPWPWGAGHPVDAMPDPLEAPGRRQLCQIAAGNIEVVGLAGGDKPVLRLGEIDETPQRRTHRHSTVAS